jgi:hypothetical protein
MSHLQKTKVNTMSGKAVKPEGFLSAPDLPRSRESSEQRKDSINTVTTVMRRLS